MIFLLLVAICRANYSFHPDGYFDYRPLALRLKQRFQNCEYDNEFVKCVMRNQSLPQNLSISFNPLRIIPNQHNLDQFVSHQFTKQLCTKQHSSKTIQTNGHRDIIRQDPLIYTIRNFGTEICKEALDLALKTPRKEYWGGESCRNCECWFEFESGDLKNLEEKVKEELNDVFDYEIEKNIFKINDYIEDPTICQQHCDQGCSNPDVSQKKKIQRAITSMLYCTVPTAGGATVFPRDDLVFKAENVGDLLVFENNFRNGTEDNGFTMHAGCGISGRKLIVLNWFVEKASQKTEL